MKGLAERRSSFPPFAHVRNHRHHQNVFDEQTFGCGGKGREFAPVIESRPLPGGHQVRVSEGQNHARRLLEARRQGRRSPSANAAVTGKKIAS
jgi:hypothetical protein